MPQDAYTLRHLCRELNNAFSNGKINKIIQPSNDDIIFTIYTAKKTERLLISVNPSCPRIGVYNGTAQAPLTAPNFCMLLRKHLLSATINQISLVGFDRIVKIDFTSSEEFFDARSLTLYIELMGRYSNVILTENGKVIGGNRGINNFDNGVRPLIAQHPYVLPPASNKKEPCDKTLISDFLTAEDTDAATLICTRVQGVAQSTATEIINGFTARYGAYTKDKIEQFFNFLNEFLYSENSSPCVIVENDSVKDVCAYPYATVSGDIKSFDTLMQAEEYYFSARDKERKFKEKYTRLSSIINAQIKKAKKRLTAINSKLKDASSAEENRLKGEILLANIYRVKQGDTLLKAENYYDGTTIDIELDPTISPSKNAERFYKKYNKQKRTIEVLSVQKEGATEELNYLTAVLDELSLSNDIDDLNSVQSELERSGLIALKQQQKGKAKNVAQTPYREYTVAGYTVLCGKNNHANDELCRSARQEDIWLHVKDGHSSHVIIKTNGATPYFESTSNTSKVLPKKVIEIAGEICAYYSKARQTDKAEIICTLKKYIKKPKGARPGTWLYENETSFTVTPNAHNENLKEN
ncbi:MAG: NFACT family protein [Clostridia bacterium]|nr:NFACT family protein [Clostridia bacterium]